MAKKRWSNVPQELLSRVADLLDLADLVRFRAVCKDFLSAASTRTATAEVGSELPWFLVYGESRCSMLSCYKTHTNNFSIKELEEATVLASIEGWLLVFKQGSMFFLCPFSRARIGLPNFPHSKLTNHVAAVSCPPSSRDCIVAIINHCDNDCTELHVISRLSWCWTTNKIHCRWLWIDTIKTATYVRGNFYFLGDKEDGGLVQCIVYRPYWNSVENGRLRVVDPYLTPEDRQLQESKAPFGILKGLIERESPYCPIVVTEFVRSLGVKELLCFNDDVSMSTCGTLFNRMLIFSENIEATPNIQGVKGVWSHRVRGVWVHPRFHQISANYSWLIS